MSCSKGKMKKKIVGWIVLMAMLSLNAWAEFIFIDHFDNDIVEDSDYEVGFWSIVETPGNLSNVVESDGEWVITAGRATGTSSAESLITSAVDSRFNFIETRLLFEADLTVSALSGMPENHARMRFLISDSIGKVGHVENAIDLLLRADNTGGLRVKTDDGDPITLVGIDLEESNPVEAFRLFLDSSGYELVLFDAEGATLLSESGPYEVNDSAWASGAALSFNVFEPGTEVPDAYAEVRMSRFAVLDGTPAEPLWITQISILQGGDIQLSGTGGPDGQAYRVLSTGDLLAEGEWEAVGEGGVFADGEFDFVYTPESLGAQRFYRLASP